jgi:hypothetical protein
MKQLIKKHGLPILLSTIAGILLGLLMYGEMPIDLKTPYLTICLSIVFGIVAAIGLFVSILVSINNEHNVIKPK